MRLLPQCIANKEFNALAIDSTDFLRRQGGLKHFFLATSNFLPRSAAGPKRKCLRRKGFRRILPLGIGVH